MHPIHQARVRCADQGSTSSPSSRKGLKAGAAPTSPPESDSSEAASSCSGSKSLPCSFCSCRVPIFPRCREGDAGFFDQLQRPTPTACGCSYTSSPPAASLRLRCAPGTKFTDFVESATQIVPWRAHGDRSMHARLWRARSRITAMRRDATVGEKNYGIPSHGQCQQSCHADCTLSEKFSRDSPIFAFFCFLLYVLVWRSCHREQA